MTDEAYSLTDFAAQWQAERAERDAYRRGVEEGMLRAVKALAAFAGLNVGWDSDDIPG